MPKRILDRKTIEEIEAKAARVNSAFVELRCAVNAAFDAGLEVEMPSFEVLKYADGRRSMVTACLPRISLPITGSESDGIH